MLKCKHECEKCNTTWECDYPYYSNHEYFEDIVQNGSYCNAFCPSCQKEERRELDELFSQTSETGYIETFAGQSLET